MAFVKCGNNSEVGKRKLPECQLAADPGGCFGFFRRWYYDPKTAKCRTFIWGGCDGNENNFETVSECLSHCRAVVTIIHHNVENCGLVDGHEAPGSYVGHVVYEGYGFWKSYDGIMQTFWAGGMEENACSCYKNNSCRQGKRCNCDANLNSWQQDSGLVTDKSVLPVQSVYFGDTGDETERGYHTIGPLRCYTGKKQLPYTERSLCNIDPDPEIPTTMQSNVVMTVLSPPSGKVYGTCAEMLNAESTVGNGFYYIDPDGPAGKLEKFVVECDMIAGGHSLVHHYAEVCGFVNDTETPGSYLMQVSYREASLEQVVSLISASKTCDQYIRYECKGSLFRSYIFDPPIIYAWWVGRDGSDQKTYWGGAAPNSDQCGCNNGNSCLMNERCNCDVNNSTFWAMDAGLLSNKDDLPVTQLRFGDTGGTEEQGYHKLGPLRCYDASRLRPYTQPDTCIPPSEGSVQT
ncbi:PREDICTED: uncharacterized protein LOC106815147, partial [Priapulus caudatus]|uniref:Uncharacterized protein LOC106815147 n=1 Tax=Priapulus caudatus TaxID=37621 RepID=A0ABM1ES95_PRICU